MMNLSNITFLLFSTLTILSGFMVVIAVNPVHSVLFLVLVFLNTAALLISLEVEFLALSLIIIYVGAIAILFLFVVMMLNIKLVISKFHFMRYLPIGVFIIFLFAIELQYMYNEFKMASYVASYAKTKLNTFSWLQQLNTLPNIDSIGKVLYTYFPDAFILGGFILLVAMIGAIILTFSYNPYVKRQNIDIQLDREPETIFIKYWFNKQEFFDHE